MLNQRFTVLGGGDHLDSSRRRAVHSRSQGTVVPSRCRPGVAVEAPPGADRGPLPAQLVRTLPARFDAGTHVVEQFEATSADGTKVPYFVVRPRNIPYDGSTPTVLYAYGGFQNSELPVYSPAIGRLWLEGIGTLVTYLGLLSAGIAIALQDLIVALAGWMFIVWRRPFVVGERLEIDGQMGDVLDIRLFPFSMPEIGRPITPQKKPSSNEKQHDGLETINHYTTVTQNEVC